MTLPAFSLCALSGMLPLLFLPVLPSTPYLFAGASIAMILLRSRVSTRCFAVALLCFCWAIGCAHHRLAAIEALSGKQQVEIVIKATDGNDRHDVQLIQHNQRWLLDGPGAMLYGSHFPQTVCSGQRWHIVAIFRPIHGRLNDGGFDSQRFALTQGKLLTGRLISATPVDTGCGVRGRYITSVRQALSGYGWADVIMALGFGERLNVSDNVKKLMRDTGTAHLMAISGLHIALAGSLGWLLARSLQYVIAVRLIGYRFPLLLSLAVAALYTWLAGSNPPALRTLISLSIWAAIRLSGRQWNAWQVWLCCIAGMALSDPLALLSESLWLSALAVASLIFWLQWMPAPVSLQHPVMRLLFGMVHLQLGICLLLMPLQILLFHGISLSAMLANLFAVPAITFITVPLILVGMLTHLLPLATVEQTIWWLADRSLGIVFFGLDALPAGWLDVDARYLWFSLLPWCAIIAWRLRLIMLIPGTLASLVLVTLFPLLQRNDSTRWAVHMLDIGHGLAIVIERQGRAILYDAGNAWPGGDSAQQTIIPWLRWHHLQPDGVIISHEHLDHRGGLDSLRQAWPHLRIRSSLGWENHLPCERGIRWQWQGLTFSAHWPLPGHKLTGNNRSCVVKVSDGQHSVLLTGDIEAAAEMAMLKRYWQHLQADVIQVPHHGSKTSSSPLLLRQLNGQTALASVARYNAWRLPAANVITRYQQQGYNWHDTAHAGQISIIFNFQGYKIMRFREHISPRWYHQWFGVPADSR